MNNRTDPDDAPIHFVTELTTRSIGSPIFRLRKHADYQRVYQASRKQFAKQMSYFFTLRPHTGPDGTSLRGADAGTPRVGLTVGKVMGKAVDRNRIKRRMREAVRRNLSALTAPVDVVLHPRRSVIDLDFATLEREVATVFRAIQKTLDRSQDKIQGKNSGRQGERAISSPDASLQKPDAGPEKPDISLQKPDAGSQKQDERS